jgi:hypothetical protein
MEALWLEIQNVFDITKVAQSLLKWIPHLISALIVLVLSALRIEILSFYVL